MLNEFNNTIVKNTPIVLVNPPANKLVEEFDSPPFGHLGLAYLGAALRKAGIDCVILDAKCGRLKYEDVVKAITLMKPKIVGVSSYTHEINIVESLIKEIKQLLPSCRTIIGGSHASSLPQDTLHAYSCFDYLVKGEGEETLVNLANAILDGHEDKIQFISGVGYRKNDNCVVVNESEWIQNPDSLAFPAWDLFPEFNVFPVISSRGCPYKCIFCARMMGNKIRTRSPENVIAELKYLNNQFGAKKIVFFDETFGYYGKWLEQFLSLMISSGMNKKLQWSIITRAQVLNDDVVGKLKKAGCTKIDFGVESGNDKILKIINKGETKEDFVRAAKLIKKSGLESHSYFILGHPYETKETAMDTINFAAQLNTDFISIGIMIPYPGTEVAKLAALGLGGYTKLSTAWEDYNKQLGNALELQFISRTDLTKLQLLGYLKFYAKNVKIKSFVITGWKYRRLILAIIMKYVKGNWDRVNRGSG